MGEDNSTGAGASASNNVHNTTTTTSSNTVADMAVNAATKKAEAKIDELEK